MFYFMYIILLMYLIYLIYIDAVFIGTKWLIKSFYINMIFVSIDISHNSFFINSCSELCLKGRYNDTCTFTINKQYTFNFSVAFERYNE